MNKMFTHREREKWDEGSSFHPQRRCALFSSFHSENVCSLLFFVRMRKRVSCLPNSFGVQMCFPRSSPSTINKCAHLYRQRQQLNTRTRGMRKKKARAEQLCVRLVTWVRYLCDANIKWDFNESILAAGWLLKTLFMLTHFFVVLFLMK